MNFSHMLRTLLPFKTPALLFLLGAISVLGFAPFYLFPATLLSVFGLSIYWQRAQSVKHAAIMGMVYGLGFYIAGIYWIYISLHDFGNMPMPMAAIATLLLCAFMASFIALTGALSVRFAKQNPLYLALLMAVFWSLSDWVRSWIFTGFPWLTIGYSQIPASPLAGFTPVIGIYGLSLISVLLASLCAYLVTQRKNLLQKTVRHIALGLVTIVIAGWGLSHIIWTKPAGKPFSVSLIQGNIAQSMKWRPEIADQTMLQYLTMVESSDAQLIVLPETALPVLSKELPLVVERRLTEQARKNRGDIVIGIVEFENGEYFNSAMSLGRSTNQIYRKSHLVPFGEFIPFKAVFGWIYRDWLNMPLSDLSRGSIHQQPMLVAGQQAALNICYEDVFGEEIIRQLPQAGLLINITNDAWYGESLAAYQHLQFSQARALETGRMMLRATNTGATAIIDTKGHVLQHAPHFQTTVVNGFAQTHVGTTLYVRVGNWLFLLLSASLLGFIWLQKRVLTSKRNPNVNL